MPDGRMVSKAISTDDTLGAVSLDADFLFGRCIPHLDSEGRMPGNPQAVKAMTVPLRDELTVDRVAWALCALADVGLVEWYEIGEKRYLNFPGFKDHQRGHKIRREAPSIIPSPADPKAAPVNTFDMREVLLRTNSRPTPDKVTLSEVKSSQGKKQAAKTEARADARVTWLVPFGAAWEAQYGGEPPYGQLGRAFKPIVERHGEAKALAHWKTYLSCTEGQYANPFRFGSTFGEWAPGKATGKKSDTFDPTKYSVGS